MVSFHKSFGRSVNNNYKRIYRYIEEFSCRWPLELVMDYSIPGQRIPNYQLQQVGLFYISASIPLCKYIENCIKNPCCKKMHLGRKDVNYFSVSSSSLFQPLCLSILTCEVQFLVVMLKSFHHIHNSRWVHYQTNAVAWVS